MTRRQISRWFGFLSLAVLVGFALEPDRDAMADPIWDKQPFAVSISLGAGPDRGLDLGLSSGASFDGLNALRFLTEPEQLQSILPDSMQFAGLAGAFNLSIDDSGERPLVEGISLAPSETLQIRAGRGNQIRGIQGHIAIRLDF